MGDISHYAVPASYIIGFAEPKNIWQDRKHIRKLPDNHSLLRYAMTDLGMKLRHRT